MSMQYWAISMYGLWERDLKLKDNADLDKLWNDECEDYITLPNGKEILLDRQYAEDEEWTCGYSLIYPWHQNPKTTPSSSEEVKEALWIKYSPVVDMTKEEFYETIDGISSANWG